MTRTRRKRHRQPPGTLGATPQRLQMMGKAYDEMSEATAGGVLKKTGAIRAWSALENLYRNRLITGPQYDAGEKLFRDWYLGHVASAQVTMKWSDYVSGLSGGGGDLDAAERKHFHAKRYSQATAAIPAPVRKPVHWLVINDIKPQDVGHRLRGYRGQRAASAAGTTAISIGLELLAKFYGLTK